MQTVLFNRLLLSFWLCAILWIGSPLLANAEEETETPFNPAFCSDLSTKGNPYEEPFKTMSFWDAYQKIKTEYHKKINTIFNESLSKIGGTTLKDDRMAAQKGAETSVPQIANILFAEYDQYACALRTKGRGVELPNDKTISLLYDSTQSLRAVEHSIDAEIDRAEAAIFITLQMYTEMRVYYPLHKKIESVIDPFLLAYRDAVREFVDEIIRFASKIVNFGSKNPVQ